MDKKTNSLAPKNHYEILDGLRGVAAIMVVAFHVFETLNGGNRFKQIINHGYLAVDFFFLLSGFVVAYAYDDRWQKMTVSQFFQRRLIRLQPMVVMGSIVGAVFFYFQACSVFPLVNQTSVWKMLMMMVIGFTLIPVPISMDIRGWQEMHPLNGPAWSLLFEYLANIFYALFVRKFSKAVLAALVFLSACLLTQYLVMGPQGDIIGGWSIDPVQLRIGFTRMLFPFFAGVLLSRYGKLIQVKGAFWICSLLLIVSFSAPRFGGTEHLWMNGLYEAFCIIILFPILVSIGAGGHFNGKVSAKTSEFLGELSYPLYITHYPLIYTYVAWVTNNKITLSNGLGVGFLLLVCAIVIAYLCLKFFDKPVRTWLTKRFLVKEVIKAD
ncbi:MAG: acyltransferase [Proteobacteria bacterium]|nr:MAG: acyltransferase [Pseudomonadota bacterium]